MSTFILGGYQSDFARHLSREGRDISELFGELIDGALEDAQVDAAEVGVIHVGNAFGPLFNGQTHLGAMAATARPALSGVPGASHEAACASGSIAILAAMAELEAGHYDVALVIGAEQERNVPGEAAARHLAAASWVGHEGGDARYYWPHAFSRIGDAYAERWGLDHAHLQAIALKNLTHAKRNPRAQTRGWTLPGSFDDERANPAVEGRLRRLDCAQATDGGAAIVLASSRRRAPAGPPRPQILGWGHRTAGLALEPKLARRADSGGLLMPHVSRAVSEARARADLAATAISGYEVHDCFTTTEYLAIDHLGLTPPGQSWRAIEDGSTQLGGRTPINASGGLIGGGHPVGATGVRMALDAARQVSGRAGELQIEGATTLQTLNIGGSLTTAVSLVIGARPA